MTKLLIAYPEVPLEFDAPDAVGNNFDIYNTLGAPRWAQYKTTSDSDLTIEYTFTEAKNIDTVFIGDAKEIISSDFSSTATDFDLALEYWDGDSWEEAASEDSINSFIGAKESDYILYYPNSESSTLWRVVITPDQDSEFKFSKLFICHAIDLGREPSSIIHSSTTNSKPTHALDGNLLDDGMGKIGNVFEFEYRHLSDAAITEFLSKLNVNEKRFLCFFNSEPNIQLSWFQCLYCELLEIDFAPVSRTKNMLNLVVNEQL